MNGGTISIVAGLVIIAIAPFAARRFQEIWGRRQEEQDKRDEFRRKPDRGSR
ncbi:hypothetical protein GIS00_16560 [Nakamurella sp. YIM 132087]|uniref:Uncharacterized protein n=1 Tax=Nakamurella alba TaxID=2665158 RepID=A0A7K1FN35_9ACTN|nr:hypothetical protein [Nakamurella alba]MTD15546.1 hypothetical protein [Nakamurella alba]